ncbi:HAD superfamily phosphatase [Thermincola ferriacetica]|uniref:HAD superfamily phosphatase n=1 Tax=Thermincola ferriacetica TaxID=281456 RepID=A0A0L6W518_9FIRM|nr:YqeG family HAD IIIA-type phosphatase [Thermincola ferriacetica]KNZ70677.1 HAD superfamily phosphatase [Thermincola ferriacetica]
MLKYLQPNLYVPSVNKIDLDKLKLYGIKALIFDLDNTLLPWRERKYSLLLEETIKRFTDCGFAVCIVSNARDSRVKNMFASMGIPAIIKAGKPRKKAFRKALHILKTRPDETAVIGDQLFTDVLGGNRMGLFTILVLPISRREFLGTRLARRVEKPILKHFIKKGVISRPRY